MSITEICEILKQCHAYGVSEFSSGALSFKFHPQGNVDAVSPGQDAGAEIGFPNVSKNLTHEAKLMDDNALDDADEAQLMIDDPFTFENAQIDRHVERNRQLGTTI